MVYLSLFLALLGSVAADFLSGSHPPPRDLASEQSLVASAWQNVTSTLDNASSNELLAGLENITYSIGMFSLHDAAATVLQYHHTSSATANSSVGTRKVDQDSIYKVASVSKLITTYTGIVALSDEDWNRPLKTIAPILSAYLQNYTDQIYHVQWNQITPWTLASQMSGIPTLGVPHPVADLFKPNESQAYGFPALSQTDLLSTSPCLQRQASSPDDTYCDATDFISYAQALHPSFLPWTTPVYSDLNFMLLGVVIANLTGQDFPDVNQRYILDPLNMTSTTFTHFPPEDPRYARSVIPSPQGKDGFLTEPIYTNPSGGFMSSIRDLQALAIAIANSTLMPAVKTRKWMKPSTFTSSHTYAYGAPWEIYRYIHPNSSRTTDIYTKLGSDGPQGGMVAIIPSYDAGFVMLNNADPAIAPHRDRDAGRMMDVVTDSVLPALEAQAAAEAARNYVGTYRSTDPALDASVTITFNTSDVPNFSSSRLQVSQWSYNDTDVLKGKLYNGVLPRLEPSIPVQSGPGEPGQVAFLATGHRNYLSYGEAMQQEGSRVYGPFTGWLNAINDAGPSVDSDRWGTVSALLFVFDVDEHGKATKCSPAVDRIVLERVDG